MTWIDAILFDLFKVFWNIQCFYYCTFCLLSVSILPSIRLHAQCNIPFDLACFLRTFLSFSQILNATSESHYANMFTSTKKEIKNATNLDVLGACFNLIGFVLMILCLFSNAQPYLSSLHFVKVTSNQQSATFGLFHYCLGAKECHRETFTLPFGKY